MFYFDTHDGDVIRDDEGTELADEAAAQRIARKALAEHMADRIARDPPGECFVKVRDEAGREVYAARLSFTPEDPDGSPSI